MEELFQNIAKIYFTKYVMENSQNMDGNNYQNVSKLIEFLGMLSVADFKGIPNNMAVFLKNIPHMFEYR